jgi:6-phosphofructokinase
MRLISPKILGVMISGGDAPSMNAAIRTVTRVALDKKSLR